MKKTDPSDREPDPDTASGVNASSFEESPLATPIPASDAAFSIVDGILKLVPVSRWTFARLNQKGDLEEIFGSHLENLDGRVVLADEFHRQRRVATTGPRIAATLGSLDGFASGLTLLFADARANFGIMTLLRTAELGPFSSSELGLMTLSLDAISHQLSPLRFGRLAKKAQVESSSVVGRGRRAKNDGALYILDKSLQIVLAWSSEDRRRVSVTGLRTKVGDRLPPLLEETVRHLTEAWLAGGENDVGTAHPVPFLVVRTQPLEGPTGLFIGVHVERAAGQSALSSALEHYHITPRETQVLALMLDGAHLEQIADRLGITSSTVQSHIKSMLERTASTNRSELIGRVLGWETGADEGG